MDLDSQASLTITAGIEPEDCKYTICDMLNKKQIKTEEVIISLEDVV